MSQADANVVENGQPNAGASNASTSRQNISNDTKKAIIDSVNSETITLNPPGGKSKFLSKYIKRIKHFHNEYQICNVNRCYHICKRNCNTSTKNSKAILKKNMN